jgi:hypothetical protein
MPEGKKPIAFRILHDFGRAMEPAMHDLRMGKLGDCYMNATLKMSCDLVYVEGFAMKEGLIPLQHAWLKDIEGSALDPTWKDGSYYFGVPFDQDFVHEVTDRTRYYGIFEGLYLLKMSADKCYEYLKSGVMKE